MLNPKSIKPLSGDTNSIAPPIRVAPKPHRMPASIKKKRKRFLSPLFDDRGHPDPHDEWDSLLPDVKAGRLIRKRKHAAPSLTNIDPNFGEEYDDAKHGAILQAELDVSHLEPFQQNILVAVIKKYWRVFSKEGVTVPVKDYECEIDTGNAKPIACRNPNFGPLETPIMKRAIAKLLELGHIEQISGGSWLSKPLLAPKPHQENITNIDDFVWRFCVNYIALNSVTRIIAMPIPRCDSAVGHSFWWLHMEMVDGCHRRLQPDSCCHVQPRKTCVCRT